jgi:hypothetical protein
VALGFFERNRKMRESTCCCTPLRCCASDHATVPVVLSNWIAHKQIRRRLSALPFNQHCACFSNIPD